MIAAQVSISSASIMQMKVRRSYLLDWADSLLQFAYEFINNFVSNQAPAEAPFLIPQLWFVKAAIVYSGKSLDNALGASSSASHHAAYLLEELLPKDNLFIKYIHNADAVPFTPVARLFYKGAK